MCGGFPLKPNKFKYKFSWTPLGVLKALRSPLNTLKILIKLKSLSHLKKLRA
jgi:saccharopine dehydrogenase (NADP+, L-glutamate forming)